MNSATALPEYAVGWGTLSLINAGLAQSKNRSGLAWFFASLFLGPFATFLIVALDRVEPDDSTGGRRPFRLIEFRKQ
jgi:hypothetical protein